MDEIANFKKMQINNYFSSQYDLSERNLNTNQIKNDLHSLIGEIPGVELNYETETLLTEDGSEPVKKEKLNSVTIYYTYEVNMGLDENNQPLVLPRFDKVTYMI